MRIRPVQDVSQLPEYGFGPVSPVWWGTLGFMAIEGTGFALVIGSYLYLAFLAPHWPPAVPPPDLGWGTLFTLVLLVSWIPNRMASRAGKEHDLRKCRLLLVAMSAFGIVLVGLRVMEFTALNVTWNQNAYGSVLWLLLGLHATHVVTDLGDTGVLCVLMFTRHARGKRFSDVSDNAFYWDFVVLTWLPIYALLYWFPRT